MALENFYQILAGRGISRAWISAPADTAQLWMGSNWLRVCCMWKKHDFDR